MKRLLTKEMSILFFLPTTIGAIIAFLYIAIMSAYIGGAVEKYPVYLLFGIVAGIYFFIQILFYFFAKRKMVASVMESLK